MDLSLEEVGFGKVEEEQEEEEEEGVLREPEDVNLRSVNLRSVNLKGAVKIRLYDR